MARALALFLLSACVIRLAPNKDARISCDEPNDQCPAGWSCIAGTCVPNDEQAPTLTLAFTQPSNGDAGVSITQPLLVAFSFDVAAETLVDRVQLTADGGAPVSLAADATAFANIFRFSPGALLPNTTYALTIAEGVEPLPGLGRASDSATSIVFTTGAAPDRTPPGPITNLLVERVEAARVRLTWTNPSDADFAGVLIVRKAAAVLSAEPQDGRTYAIGAQIGDAVVISSIDGASWDDVTVGTAASDYALFAFDRASNYAAPVRAPFVSSITLGWCPTETGSVSVASPDVGTYRLHVGAVDFPAADVPLGTDTPLAAAGPFTLGTQVSIRVEAKSTGGRFLSLAEPFWVSKKDLTPNVITPDVRGVGGAVTMSFPRFGWPAFEAAVDTQPLPGATTFAPIPGGEPTTVPATAGSYVLRVRPVVSGCADAPWTESAEFSVGIARFVKVGGGGDGSSATAPTGSIDGAIATAPDGTDIFVAGGTYNEYVTLLPGRRLFGGFDATFATRDPAANVTTITGTPSSNTAVVTIQGSVTGNTPSIDGFTIDARGTGNVTHAALAMSTTANVTNNVIYAGGLSADQGGGNNNRGAALIADNAHDGVISGNTLRASAWHSAGLVVLNTNDLTVEDNDISGHVGIDVQSGQVVIRDNTLTFPTDARALDRTGVTMTGAGVIEENRILGGASDVPWYTNGLIIGSAYEVTVRRNRIHGGRGLPGSRGIYFVGAGTAYVENNLISAGHATAGIRAAIACDADTGGKLFVSNNTIHTGTGATTTGVAFQLAGPGLIATNNLVFGSDTWTLVEEASFAAADPSSFDHNVILSSPRDLYENDFETNATTPAQTTTQAMEDLLWCQLIPAENNVLASALVPSAVFTDVDGADDEIETLADNDWSLVAGVDASVGNGGVGPSGPAGGCGAAVAASGSTMTSGCSAPARLGPCHLPTTNFDGATRTAPFSVGAF